MNLGVRNRFSKIREKLQALALPIDHPEDHQLSPKLRQRFAERAAEVADAGLVPGSRVDDDRAVAAALDQVDEIELSLLNDLISVGLDATTFTDRKAPNPLRPSELDLTPELIFHKAAYEVHLAFEVDAPLDQCGLTQKYIYLLGVWSFDLLDSTPPPPLEWRNQIPSP